MNDLGKFGLTLTMLVALASLTIAGAADARGGGGVALRPGYIPNYSVIDVPSGPPVTMAIGGRGVGYLGRFFRIGGEGYGDFRTGIGTGGVILELALPLPGPLEIDLGGTVGGGSYGPFMEPGFTLQIGQGPFAVDLRISYQWHPVKMPGDRVGFHRGLTYFTVGFMFGKF